MWISKKCSKDPNAIHGYIIRIFPILFDSYIDSRVRDMSSWTQSFSLLNWATCHWNIRGSGDIAPHIFSFCLRKRLVDRFTGWSLYCRERSPVPVLQEAVVPRKGKTWCAFKTSLPTVTPIFACYNPYVYNYVKKHVSVVSALVV
jgi:hypothetical protein